LVGDTHVPVTLSVNALLLLIFISSVPEVNVLALAVPESLKYAVVLPTIIDRATTITSMLVAIFIFISLASHVLVMVCFGRRYPVGFRARRPVDLQARPSGDG